MEKNGLEDRLGSWADESDIDKIMSEARKRIEREEGNNRHPEDKKYNKKEIDKHIRFVEDSIKEGDSKRENGDYMRASEDYGRAEVGLDLIRPYEKKLEKEIFDKYKSLKKKVYGGQMDNYMKIAQKMVKDEKWDEAENYLSLVESYAFDKLKTKAPEGHSELKEKVYEKQKYIKLNLAKEKVKQKKYNEVEDILNHIKWVYSRGLEKELPYGYERVLKKVDEKLYRN